MLELAKKRVLNLVALLGGVAVRYAGLSLPIRFAQRQRITILNYHGILPSVNKADALACVNMVTCLKRFERQMEYVAKNYNSITLRHYLEWKNGERRLPPHPCVITFDDGYFDFFENAWPVLRRLELKATLFLIGRPLALAEGPWLHTVYGIVDRLGVSRCADFFSRWRLEVPQKAFTRKKELLLWIKSLLVGLERPLRWQLLKALQAELDESQNKKKNLYMGKREVQILQDAEVELGCHSMEHEYLTSLDESDLDEDIQACKRALAEITKTEPDLFCYPMNDWNESVIRALKRNGFIAACTSSQGLNDRDTPSFCLRRINSSCEMPFPAFIWRVLGLEAALINAFRPVGAFLGVQKPIFKMANTI